MDDKIFATITLALEDVDVVLNALEEKALSVSNLRTSIYETVKRQIPKPETQVEEEETKEDASPKRKGKRK